MNLIQWQLLFTISTFFTIILCCLTPLLILRSIGSHGSLIPTFQARIFGWLNCLIGGIFLAICFLSLLPNVQHHFTLALHHQTPRKNTMTTLIEGFPLAECVVLVGYFLVLAAEQLSRQCTLKKRQQTSRLVEMDALIRANGDENRTYLHENDEEEESEVLNDGLKGREGHCHHDHTLQLLKSSSKGLKFVVLLLALTAHAVFEGVVLGLQENVEKAVRLFVPILTHEAVVAVILGFNMTRAKQGVCTALGYSLIFALTIPIGIWLGVAVGHTPGSLGHYVSGTVQGLAAGMFLHITFMQLLAEEFAEHCQDGLLKTLFMFIGFLFLLILNIAMGGHH